MTEEQATNLINRGRTAYEQFIEAKDAYVAFAADYFNLKAANNLAQEHFNGSNAGLDLATFHDAFQKMGAVLQSDEVEAATPSVYQIGRR